MIFKFLDLLSSPTGYERNLKAIWQYKPLTFSLPSVKHHGRSIIMLGSSENFPLNLGWYASCRFGCSADLLSAKASLPLKIEAFSGSHSLSLENKLMYMPNDRTSTTKLDIYGVSVILQVLDPYSLVMKFIYMYMEFIISGLSCGSIYE